MQLAQGAVPEQFSRACVYKNLPRGGGGGRDLDVFLRPTLTEKRMKSFCIPQRPQHC